MKEKLIELENKVIKEIMNRLETILTFEEFTSEEREHLAKIIYEEFITENFLKFKDNFNAIRQLITNLKTKELILDNDVIRSVNHFVRRALHPPY
uniref:Uncharacterized protein n=1 Tax=viral metagenome TaxID=1070528 RepID=A0A6M3IEV7_9ZZZZ